MVNVFQRKFFFYPPYNGICSRVESMMETRSIADPPIIICCSFFGVIFDRSNLGATIRLILSKRSDLSSPRQVKTC